MTRKTIASLEAELQNIWDKKVLLETESEAKEAEIRDLHARLSRLDTSERELKDSARDLKAMLAEIETVLDGFVTTESIEVDTYTVLEGDDFKTRVTRLLQLIRVISARRGNVQTS